MVNFSEFNSRGQHNWIIRELRRAQRAGEAIERGVSRPLMISNVTQNGVFIGDADEALRRMMVSLRDCRRLYRQGNAVVFLGGGYRVGGGCLPTTIAIDGEITSTAPAIVRNVFMCRETKANSKGKGARPNLPLEYDVQFAVPKPVLQQVVAMDGFMEEIPEARFIVNHPVFDVDFHWLGTGYHESQRLLVCGDSFDPMIWEPTHSSRNGTPEIHDVLDLLPPLIRRWVEGFHWNNAVDLINYIGSALMIPLMPMLVTDGHPGVMFWGNQPGIGKSLAAQCLAILKDGEQASPTAIDGGSREIENQIASELNDGRTVLFIDNQKGSLNVPILEANMTAARLGIRVFKAQRKLRRPNDVLWLLTTNDAIPSDDLLSRCIHIRLHYEGIPDAHRYAMSEKDLVDHVRGNRLGILAELAGMVACWLDAGRPGAPADCRFGTFGRVVGSVLTFNGLPGFLSNTREEVREHSTKHQQLVAIAERLLDSRDRGFVWSVDCDIEQADDEFKRRDPPDDPKEQKDWVHILQGAGVIPPCCNSSQKQKTSVTQYMRNAVKTPVEVDVGDVTVRVMLVSRSIGGRRVAYALAVEGLPALPESGGADETADASYPSEPPVDPPSVEAAPMDHSEGPASNHEQEDDLWSD